MGLIDGEELKTAFPPGEMVRTECVRATIDHMPIIEPRPRGRWISMSDVDGDYYCCSQCGEELPRYSLNTPTWDDPYTYLRSIEKTNFCPNCGSDNSKEEQNEH